MRTLIVVSNFIPEIGSAAHLYFDLAQALIKKGHEVDVITSYPRGFNTCNGELGDCPLHEVIGEIRIHRCDHRSKRDNMFLRGMEHFIIPWHYYRQYRKLDKKFDVCLIYIPPLPLYYLASFIKRYDGTPSVLNFQDFHPQELIDVGVMKNRLAIKIMEHIEKRSYQNADHITTISDGGIEYIKNKGCGHGRLTTIYNGTLLSALSRSSSNNDFKEREGIKEKALISYAGILSPFQGIDNILDAAKLLGHEDGIQFYIIGDGISKSQLAARIQQEAIENVRMLPLQPRDEYYNIINSSDISLISLDGRMKAPCVPGKLANLLAAKKAIIAIVPASSETGRIIKRAGCGIVVEPGDTRGLEGAILRLINEPGLRSHLGEMGRVFLEQNMNMESCATQYENVFTDLIRQSSSRAH